MLAEAGIPEGFELHVDSVEFQRDYSSQAELFVTEMEALGFNVVHNVEPDFGSFIQHSRSVSYKHVAWGFDGQNAPLAWLVNNYRSDGAKNASGMDDRLDADIDDILTTIDVGEQQRKAKILQDTKTLQALPGEYIDAETINKVLIPKVIHDNYPDLDKEEIEQVRQHVVADAGIKSGKIEQRGDKRIVQMGGKFVNIENLHIDLIDKVNPFQKAFEILSKQVTTSLLKTIRDTINATRIEMTDDEARRLYHKAGQFKKDYDRLPSINSRDPKEKRMAEALIYLQKKRQS